MVQREWKACVTTICQNSGTYQITLCSKHDSNAEADQTVSTKLGSQLMQLQMAHLQDHCNAWACVVVFVVSDDTDMSATFFIAIPVLCLR